MKFWDSSAVVALLVEQEKSKALLSILKSDRTMVTWWGTRVECASAVSRLEREKSLNQEQAETAFSRLKNLVESWNETQPTSLIQDTAIRFLRVHPLRAADALQLAAAFIVSETRPSSLEFISLDQRLNRAAGKEGFEIPSIKRV